MSTGDVIEPNSLIVIIAISGFLGSYCGLDALRAGYRVRGTVRSLERGKTIKEAYIKQGVQNIDRLELVVLDDLNSVEQYRKAFDGADAVIHAAISWNKFGQTSFVDEVVRNTRSMLQATKLVSSVKRVVYTSSIVAVIEQGNYLDRPATAEDWNDKSQKTMEAEVAAGRIPPVMTIYAAAKTSAEKAAWEFMKQEKPHFDLVCVLPATFSGPWLHGGPPFSATFLPPLFNGDSSMARGARLNRHVDIRDSSKIYLKCLVTPSLGGKRLLCVNEPHGWNQILAILRKNFPNVKTIAEDMESPYGDIWAQPMDNMPAKELLGGFIDLEQGIVAQGKCLGY